MDPSTDTNQDPLAANDNGATSFAPDFDMSAINEAVAMGGEAENIQNSFDVNDIDLNNTPTTDADLQKQLNEDPNMSLAGAQNNAINAPEEKPQAPVAAFVDGDLANEEPAVAESNEPAAAESNISSVNEGANIETAPAELAPSEPGLTESESAEQEPAEQNTAEQEPSEPATIADLANAASFDSVVSQAPEPAPSDSVTPEKAPEIAAAPAKTEEGKSKLPTYILVGLAVIAVVAVVIAVIVSL